MKLRIRKGRFTFHVNGMTSDGQNYVAATVPNSLEWKVSFAREIVKIFTRTISLTFHARYVTCYYPTEQKAIMTE
jgi:hypothetical protein